MILCLAVRAYRDKHKVSIRQLAKIVGVPHYTLFRFERGEPVEADVLQKVLCWILKRFDA